MDNSSTLLNGKLVRTDGVIGVFYSPVIEDFFHESSAGDTTNRALFPDHIETELYEVSNDVLRDLDMTVNASNQLRDARGNVNLQFLRQPGLGDSALFDRPVDAIHKWYPEGSNDRQTWLDYVYERGFEEDEAPEPPGITIRAPSKYSNAALKEVVGQARAVAQSVYDNFVRQVEVEFEVEIESNHA